ncbi:hypothetical protein RSOLAG22IIIB_03478 [Rhizoctonia solani]|uniref:Glycoside hydrolase family 5 domain-containing protein n=1 Tax=Rhizoctonia solani TaxID=456999 RepID=A0A0K6FQD8_9AGAM|nr:hypothetical protein RSOLAG22IIIB_03478 [Rhizoctonia solani]
MSRQQIQVPPAPAPSPLGILKLEGSKIVGKDGKPVLLRGAGLGGHLNMENCVSKLLTFLYLQITGYPGHETDMRKAVKKVLGQEKYDYFFDKFLEYFFTEKDAEFFASLGLNCIRIPFNYRHFEDDLNPGVYNERGFQWLDRIINLCAHHGIYTILDLHAAPGGQNVDWHCDTGIHRALFWEHIEFQNRAIALWEELARRYKGNTWVRLVAGYNPLNEPTDEEHTRVLDWYARAEKAIHAVDPDHILFWDGNTFAADLSHFGDPLPGSVYSIHDYSTYGFPQISEPYEGTPEQKAKLEGSFKRKIAYHEKIGGHIWNGEFGPVYASPADGPEWEKINERRYHVLKDQLALYDQYQISWSIWLYKDIGFQGMVHAAAESPYIKLFASFLAKKKRLAADSWGADTTEVQSAFDPIEKLISEHVTHINHRYPPTWKVGKHGKEKSTLDTSFADNLSRTSRSPGSQYFDLGGADARICLPL